MSRDLEAGADSALQAGHVSQVVFLEFDFASGVSRACSREHDVAWNGYTWVGAGRVGSIEPLNEGGELEARGLAMTLSALPAGLLATALNPAEYKGRNVKLWFGQIEPDIVDFDFTQATLTAQVGAALASLTVTRAGATATRVNAQGLIETVAADTPRFDYDPVTLECKGLLMEEARVNRVPYGGLDNWSAGLPTGWTKGANATLTQVTGCTVGGSAARFTASLGGNVGTNRLSSSTGIISISTQYVISARVRRVSGSGALSVGVDNTGTNSIYAGTDTVNWSHVSWTFTASGTSASGFFFYPNTANDTFEIDNVQLEQAVFATSWIPTEAAAVTRNADSIKCNSIGGFYNANEGTLFAEGKLLPGSSAAGISQVLTSFNENVGNEEIDVRRNTGTTGGLVVFDGGALQCFVGGVAVSDDVLSRIAGAYKANDFAGSVDGAAAQKDSAGTLPAVTQLEIGSRGGGLFLNGHLRHFTYYPKRLSDASLVALSGGEDPQAHAVGRRISADPVGPFIFKMDQLTYRLGASAAIRLTAESRLADWMRPRVRRYNDADHQALHPGDKFFEHVERQVEAVHLW